MVAESFRHQQVTTMVENSWLEVEFHSKFAGEGVWNNYPTRRNERVGLSKRGLPNVSSKIVSEVCSIGDIEHLEEHVQRRLFFDSEIFAYPSV